MGMILTAIFNLLPLNIDIEFIIGSPKEIDKY